MVHRLAAALVTFSAATAFAQQSLPPPTPLYQGSPPRSIEAETLPPLAPAPQQTAPSSIAAPSIPAPLPASPAPAVAGPSAERVFCDQTVAVHFIDPAVIPNSYRQFVGIWSDASWTPQLCAALIVENVQPDGAAALVYVFGPMGSNTRRRAMAEGRSCLLAILLAALVLPAMAAVVSWSRLSEPWPDPALLADIPGI